MLTINAMLALTVSLARRENGGCVYGPHHVEMWAGGGFRGSFFNRELTPGPDLPAELCRRSPDAVAGELSLACTLVGARRESGGTEEKKKSALTLAC